MTLTKLTPAIKFTFTLAVVITILLIAFSNGAVDAQTVRNPTTATGTDAEPIGPLEWQMFSERVAGTGGGGGAAGGGGSFSNTVQPRTGNPVYGDVWMYNRRTGKIYRVFSQCAESDGGYTGNAGCLIAVRIYSSDRLDRHLPNPQVSDPPGLEW